MLSTLPRIIYVNPLRSVAPLSWRWGKKCAQPYRCADMILRHFYIAKTHLRAAHIFGTRDGAHRFQ